MSVYTAVPNVSTKLNSVFIYGVLLELQDGHWLRGTRESRPIIEAETGKLAQPRLCCVSYYIVRITDTSFHIGIPTLCYVQNQSWSGPKQAHLFSDFFSENLSIAKQRWWLSLVVSRELVGAFVRVHFDNVMECKTCHPRGI